MSSNNSAVSEDSNLANDGSCRKTSCCPPKVTVRREQPKIGRNDPCFCGSEKKYKKCCGKTT